MIKVIYKYPIYATGTCYLPKDAEVLKIGVQNDEVHLWALVNPEDIDITAQYHIIGTGQEVEKGLRYLDTVFVDEYVWHIFKEKTNG